MVILLMIPSLGFNQTVYYVNATATGANNGTSWANAFTSLDQALAIAFVGEEIWLAKGVYTPASKTSSFQLVSGVTIYGGFDGTETNREDRDPSKNPSILSGDLNGDDNPTDVTANRSDNAIHVILVPNGVIEAGLDGLVISGGQTEGLSGINDARRGGGILAYGSVNIHNCIFRSNYGYFGGAFYPRDVQARFNVTDCIFSNNLGDLGGAIYTLGASSGLIQNCKFESNVTRNSGSALYIQQSPVIVSGCSFTDNELRATGNNVGGAIFLNAAPASIENCEFIGNSVTANGTSGARGGAMWIVSSNAQINGCTFVGNSASNSGGAIHVTGFNATTKFTLCIFENNSSTFGGAITNYNSGTNPASFLKVEFDQCSFKDNTAGTSGGGISNGFKTQARVTNTLFEGNTARFGGAVFAQNDSTDLYYADCEFRNNQATSSGGAFNSSVGNRSTVLRCLFEANSGSIGGAMHVSEDTVDRTNLILSQSNFNFNSATMQGAAINFQNADATLTNNVFSNNFILEGTGAGGALSINCVNGDQTLVKLINNTLVNNEAPTGTGIGAYTDENTVVKIQLLNNIFVHPTGPSLAVEAGLPEFESLGGNLDSEQNSYLNQSSDQNGKDPLFVDINLDNYRLKAGSPCINAGVNLPEAPKIDIEGRNRDQMPDIGCHEFGGSINTHNPLTQGSWWIYPSADPNKMVLGLDYEWHGEFQIQITDAEGKQLQTSEFYKTQDQQEFEIQMTHTVKGVNFIRLQKGQVQSTKSIVK